MHTAGQVLHNEIDNNVEGSEAVTMDPFAKLVYVKLKFTVAVLYSANEAELCK